MHAALETTVEFDISYFTLGNIYAVSNTKLTQPLFQYLIFYLNTSNLSKLGMELGKK